MGGEKARKVSIAAAAAWRVKHEHAACRLYLTGDKTARITVELIRQIGIAGEDIGVDVMSNDVLVVPGGHVCSGIKVHR